MSLEVTLKVIVVNNMVRPSLMKLDDDDNQCDGYCRDNYQPLFPTMLLVTALPVTVLTNKILRVLITACLASLVIFVVTMVVVVRLG